MLTHLSSKFQLGHQQQTHEPRAALFLNRFTRTLTIMYATSGIEQIIGVSGEDMKGRSFYYCIQENCLEDAVRCLESAKGNDSIAYLRFWFRDPRAGEEHEQTTSSAEDTDEMMTDITASASEDEADGGLDSHGDTETSSGNRASGESSNPSNTESQQPQQRNHFASGGESSGNTTSNSAAPRSQSLTDSPSTNGRRDAIELEAVVSCTSDGLVVCLRRARPILPPSAQPHVASQPTYTNGLFAAPWAAEPVFVPALQNNNPPQPANANFPVGYYGEPIPGAAANAYPQYRRGPQQSELMASIRDVAVFAWALTGINGCLAEFSRGSPLGESQPPEGFPVWQPQLPPMVSGQTPLSGYASAQEPFGDPGITRGDTAGSGSSHDSSNNNPTGFA